jgi:hypothetical protein
VQVIAARVSAALVGGLLIATGCTSEQGALPPPATTAEPTAPATGAPPATGIADDALLTAADVGAAVNAEQIDAAERWADALDVTAHLVSLRPDCQQDLARITATLADTPSDAAGAGFIRDDGQEVLHFTGVAGPEAGAALVASITDLVARCDAYKLQVPERGSLVMSVRPVDVAPPTAAPGISTTGWQTTVFSDHLRWTQQYAALSVDGIVGFLAVSGGDITGEPPMSMDELADLVAAAIERSEEAGR